MILMIILIFVVCLFLFFLGFQVWRYLHPRENADWRLIPIDLEAFSLLTDPEEERYLQMNLGPGEFRAAQRMRIRAAKTYVAAFSQNAKVLVAAGLAARDDSDQETAARAAEIVQKAIRLRVWCLLSLIRLNTAFLFPGLLSPSSEIANPYRVVSLLAMKLPGNAFV